jgi:outer membrane receptor protein involved in Fe transport
MQRKLSQSLMAVLMAMLLCCAMLAQTSRATVTGKVVDPTGAAIVGAKVLLISPDTNITREVATNDQGEFRFDAVNLGAYQVKVTAQGFDNAQTQNFTVSAARTTDLPIALKIGTNETVSVDTSAAIVALQTEEQTRSQQIDSKSLANLPIVNQNSLRLMLTLPGVVSTNNSGSLDSGIGSVNGSRPRSNNFMIDGVENNDISVAGPSITLTNNDAIQEVSVQTSNFSAEFGRAGGAVINQVTKSGTNHFHGTAAEVYRSQIFDASSRGQRIGDPNPTSSNPVHKPFKENIPAFTFGGPVKIPGLYDGKDRTFFFAGAQWDRYSSGQGQYTGSSYNFNVPTAKGIATLQALAGSCPNAALYLKALNGLVAPTATGTIDISVPQNVFNVTGTCNGNNRVGMGVEYGVATRTVPIVSLADNHVVRIDHKINESQQIMGRWLWSQAAQPYGGYVGVQHAFDADYRVRNMQAAINHTWILSNTFTNEVRVNFARLNPQFPVAQQGPVASLPTFAIPTLDTVGLPSTMPQGRTADSYQFQDTVSTVVGRHQLRYGVDMMRQIARQIAPFNVRGAVSYTASALIKGASNTGAVTGLANFLDDYSGSTGTVAESFGSPLYHPTLFRHSYFIQDAWKFSPTLTLNLGLRYENFGQAANGFKLPVVSLDPNTFGTPNKVNPDNNNFGPTVGFAWNPRDLKFSILNKFIGDGKTVLRGGFQTSYDSLFNNLLSNMAAGTPNNPSNIPVNAVPSNTAPRGISQLYAQQFAKMAPAALNPLTNASSQFTKDMPNPYTDRMSLGVQRELPSKMVLDVAYVGSLSRKQYITRELNPFTPNAANTAIGTRLNPSIGGRSVRTSGGNANYNGLQIQLRRGISNTIIGDLAFSTSYTWSKNMDTLSEAFATNASGSTGSSLYTILTNRNLDYGRSDNDRTHVWSSTFQWDARGPKEGWMSYPLGGWSFTGVVPIQSGQPYTVLNGLDRDLDGVNTSDRPDVGNWSAPANTRALIDTKNCASTGYINPDTNTCVTPNQVRWVQVAGGNAPNANTERRNALVSSASILVNLNAFKTFKLAEGWNLEYRAEIFNLLNSENFDFVPQGTNLNSATAGRFLDFSRYSSTAADPKPGNRSMRMGLKLIF